MYSSDGIIEKCYKVSQSIIHLLKCSICLDLFVDPVSVGCGHFFCRGCINTVLKVQTDASCPICQKKFTKRHIQDSCRRQKIVIAADALIKTIEDIKENGISKDMSKDSALETVNVSSPEIPIIQRGQKIKSSEIKVSKSVRKIPLKSHSKENASREDNKDQDGVNILPPVTKKLTEKTSDINNLEQSSCKENNRKKPAVAKDSVKKRETKFYDLTAAAANNNFSEDSEDFINPTASSKITARFEKKEKVTVEKIKESDHCIVKTKKCIFGKKTQTQESNKSKDDDPYIFNQNPELPAETNDDGKSQKKNKRQTKNSQNISQQKLKRNLSSPRHMRKRKKVIPDSESTEKVISSNHDEITFELTRKSDISENSDSSFVAQKETLNEVCLAPITPIVLLSKSHEVEKFLAEKQISLETSDFKGKVVKTVLNEKSEEISNNTKCFENKNDEQDIDSLLSRTSSIKVCQQLVNNTDLLLNPEDIASNESPSKDVLNAENECDDTEQEADVENAESPKCTPKCLKEGSPGLEKSPGWSRFKQMNKDFHLKKFPSLEIQKSKTSPNALVSESLNNLKPISITKKRKSLTENDRVESKVSAVETTPTIEDENKNVKIASHTLDISPKKLSFEHDEISETPLPTGQESCNESILKRTDLNDVESPVKSVETYPANVLHDDKSEDINNNSKLEDNICKVLDIEENKKKENGKNEGTILDTAPFDIDYDMDISENNGSRLPDYKVVETSVVKKVYGDPPSPVFPIITNNTNSHFFKRIFDSFEEQENTEFQQQIRKMSEQNDSHVYKMHSTCKSDPLKIKLSNTLKEMYGKHRKVYRFPNTNSERQSRSNVECCDQAVCKAIKRKNSPSIEENVHNNLFNENFGNSAKKEKVIKRICLTFDEICSHFKQNSLTGEMENICTVSLPFSDFKLQLDVSNETLNVSVLKILNNSVSECSTRNSNANEKTEAQNVSYILKEFKDVETQFSLPEDECNNFIENMIPRTSVFNDESLDFITHKTKRRKTQSFPLNSTEISESDGVKNLTMNILSRSDTNIKQDEYVNGRGLTPNFLNEDFSVSNKNENIINTDDFQHNVSVEKSHDMNLSEKDKMRLSFLNFSGEGDLPGSQPIRHEDSLLDTSMEILPESGDMLVDEEKERHVSNDSIECLPETQPIDVNCKQNLLTSSSQDLPATQPLQQEEWNEDMSFFRKNHLSETGQVTDDDKNMSCSIDVKCDRKSPENGNNEVVPSNIDELHQFNTSPLSLFHIKENGKCDEDFNSRSAKNSNKDLNPEVSDSVLISDKVKVLEMDYLETTETANTPVIKSSRLKRANLSKMGKKSPKANFLRKNDSPEKDMKNQVVSNSVNKSLPLIENVAKSSSSGTAKHISSADASLPDNFDFDPFSDDNDFCTSIPLGEFNPGKDTESFSSDPDMIFATSLVAPLKDFARKNKSEELKNKELSSNSLKITKNLAPVGRDNVKRFKRISSFCDSSDSEEWTKQDETRENKLESSKNFNEANKENIQIKEIQTKPDNLQVLASVYANFQNDSEQISQSHKGISGEADNIKCVFGENFSCDDDISETASKIELEISEMNEHMRRLQQELDKEEKLEKMKNGIACDVNNEEQTSLSGNNEQIPPTPPKSETKVEKNSNFASKIYRRNS